MYGRDALLYNNPRRGIKRLSITKVISLVMSDKKANKADYKQYRYH